MENLLPLETSESKFITIDNDGEQKVNFNTLQPKI